MDGLRLVKFLDDIMYDVDSTGKTKDDIEAEKAIWIPEEQHNIKRNNDSWVWNGLTFEAPTQEYLAEQERLKQERQTKYELETKRHYLALGQFLVRFEHTMMLAQQLAEYLLSANGLNFELSKMFIRSNEVTAGKLCELLQKIINRTDVLNTYLETKDLILICLKLLQLVINERNDIIHGKLFVGYVNGDDESFSSFRGYRDKISTTGHERKSFLYSVEDIERLIMRCKAMEDCFRNFHFLGMTGWDAGKETIVGGPIQSVRKAIAIALSQKDFWKQPNSQRENEAKSILPELQKYIDAYPQEGQMFRLDWKPLTL
ncbi:MAG: hypothetical protein H9535_21885 [Ignavibacteria bacterium]|nr:hypothetical protein [Ignavibacteria bacterium]